VAALIADIGRVFNRRPTLVKELTAEFRSTHEIGSKTPVAKAITTRERADWLRTQIDQLLAQIAEFDEAAKAGQEVAA
jgi:hypothetical protein